MLTALSKDTGQLFTGKRTKKKAPKRAGTKKKAATKKTSKNVTVRKPRKKAFVYSDAYTTRVTLHRRLAWTMLPLFAASYFSGNELLKAAGEGRPSASWARNVHGPAATGSAILFGANALTGSVNLWEGKGDPNGRVRRVLHSVLFMAASGGFVYAGTKLANDAEQSQDLRIKHRNIAIASMGVSTFSWLIMLIGN